MLNEILVTNGAFRRPSIGVGYRAVSRRPLRARLWLLRAICPRPKRQERGSAKAAAANGGWLSFIELDLPLFKSVRVSRDKLLAKKETLSTVVNLPSVAVDCHTVSA